MKLGNRNSFIFSYNLTAFLLMEILVCIDFTWIFPRITHLKIDTQSINSLFQQNFNKTFGSVLDFYPVNCLFAALHVSH